MKRLSHILLAITFVLLSLICMIRCKREPSFPEKITISTKDLYVDTSKKFISSNSGFSKYCTNYVFILDSLDNVKKVIGYFQMKNADVCNLYE